MRAVPTTHSQRVLTKVGVKEVAEDDLKKLFLHATLVDTLQRREFRE